MKIAAALLAQSALCFVLGAASNSPVLLQGFDWGALSNRHD